MPKRYSALSSRCDKTSNETMNKIQMCDWYEKTFRVKVKIVELPATSPRAVPKKQSRLLNAASHGHPLKTRATAADSFYRSLGLLLRRRGSSTI